jgi:hypothetical protein
MKKLGATGTLAVTIAVVLVVVGFGWFGLISPQRAKSSDLDTKTAAAESLLASEQHVISSASTKSSLAALHSAQRALPDTPQMSELLRQLSTYATEAQAELDSVTPTAPVAATVGGEVQPLSVTVRGKYFAVQHFMQLLRKSADFKKGKITGTGRLYSVDSVQFAAAPASGDSSSGASSKAGVTATIGMNAYIYASMPAAATAAATATTTPSTDASATSAAGATP